MTQRYALGLQYDGRDWLGWQSQPGGRTVQDSLEAALSRFADEPLRVVAAGRTDSGVHASAQVVHFDCGATRPAHAWVRGLNSLLPASIAARWVQPVDESFHARFGAISRTYHYVLYVDPIRSAHLARRAGWFYHPLDVAAMRAAASVLIGTHDFTAFRSAECQAASPVRTLHALEIEQRGRFVVLRLHADAFLHHMVRNIVGSLVSVGRGRQPVQWMAEVLQGRDRSLAAATFMPDGLYLTDVAYPERYGLPRVPGLVSAFPGLLGELI